MTAEAQPEDAEGAEVAGFDGETILRTRDGDELVVHLRRACDPSSRVSTHRPSAGTRPSLLAEHARGVVLLLHGAGEHARRYARLADELADAGFSTIAPDQLAHGRTGRRAGRLGGLPLGGNARALRAVDEVLDEAVRRAAGRPVILLGHSWGSLLGQRLLARGRGRLAAAVFSGTTLPLPGYLNPGRLDAAFEPDPTGLLWLSRDPAARRAFADDPDCFDIAVTPVWHPLDAGALLGAPRPGWASRSADVPVLILAGSEDRIGYGRRGPEALARALRRLGAMSDVTLRVFEGARHEVFNESNRGEVVAALLDWLDERFPRT